MSSQFELHHFVVKGTPEEVADFATQFGFGFTPVPRGTENAKDGTVVVTVGDEPVSFEDEPAEPQKRGRGRPKKEQTKPAEPKRPRGRPKKTVAASEPEPEESSEKEDAEEVDASEPVAAEDDADGIDLDKLLEAPELKNSVRPGDVVEYVISQGITEFQDVVDLLEAIKDEVPGLSRVQNMSARVKTIFDKRA